MICAEQNNAQERGVSFEPPMQGMPWHVLHVRSNFEKRVAQHLMVRTVEHYVPLYREHVKWTDRSVITERPLFSGYVFARFLPEQKIAVISIPGVVRSLGDEEGNLVSCVELDRIREALRGGLQLRPHPQVSVGMRVRISSGIFEGAQGIVTELRQQCKVILTLAAAQLCFTLEVKLNEIEVLTESAPIPDPPPSSGFGRLNLQTVRP